jgi:hypothetical protein
MIFSLPLRCGRHGPESKTAASQCCSAWRTNALAAPDQLHQRVGYALAQWFVISTDHPFLSGRNWTCIDYYDLLLDGINGSFSDLKTLVRAIMLHPDAVDGLSDDRAETGRLDVAPQHWGIDVVEQVEGADDAVELPQRPFRAVRLVA